MKKSSKTTTKIRRFIKRHLISYLFYGFLAFVFLGVFFVLCHYANLERGYPAMGGEFCFLILFPLICKLAVPCIRDTKEIIKEVFKSN